jgi:carbon monoxide dehydrogenase subunit G
MIFTTREDIEAPIEAVFDMLCDFESFERSAMRRGAEVQRVDKLTSPGPGMTWNAVFQMRGRRREMQIEMVTFDRPNEMVLESTSPGIVGQMRFDLIALSRSRTRLAVALEVKPLNLSARLLVQSLKLGKGRLQGRYNAKVSEYARGMEDRYARSA